MILKLLSKDEIIRKYLELEKDRERLKADFEKIKREKEALEKELRKYKNPNTPPSAHPHLKPMTARSVDVKSHKRGAPSGHNGSTKPRKIPDEIRYITGQECPGCSSNDISVIGQKHQQQEEMPPEIQPLVVDVVRDVCRCNKCKLKFLARDGMIPEDNMLL